MVGRSSPASSGAPRRAQVARVGQADQIDVVAFVTQRALLVAQHGDAVVLQRRARSRRSRRCSHDCRAPRSGRAAHRAAPGRRDDVRRDPSAAEQLHVDEVAAMQREIGLEGLRLGDDRGEARDVARMRAGMQVGEERDAQRPRRPRPSGDRKIEPARQMRLRARNPLEPTLAAFLVAIGRPQHGAQQRFERARAVHVAPCVRETGRSPARQRRSSISPAGMVASTGVVGRPAAPSSSVDPVIADPEDAELPFAG